VRVFICGIDGYLGHSLACHLASQGHEIGGLDNGNREEWVRQVGSQSAIPIDVWGARARALRSAFKDNVMFRKCDMCEYDSLAVSLEDFAPDAVVHLAEQPSAPFSMIDAEHARLTQENNVLGSLNLLWAVRELGRDIHILKLGTMGEYGTPGIPIPEGAFPPGAMWTKMQSDGDVYLAGDLGGLQFPRDPGSFYHASKVHDTVNTILACKTWGLRSTDVMQGVVYGTRIPAMGDDPRLATRFDFDQCFGTAINRFVAQAVIGAPITPYGSGGQKRGFLPLIDSMRCLTLLLENPPEEGEYRTVNQIAGIYQLDELASAVRHACPIPATIEKVDNPRKEAAEHAYEVDHSTLQALGYEPTLDLEGTLTEMFADLMPHAGRIRECRAAMTPTIRWDK